MTSFDDGKDERALRTIGEVGEALGIKAHVLRYWEGQFPQLQPMKRSGGRRYYRPEDIALVEEIDRLVNREGYTLRGAKAALAAADKPAAEAVDAPGAKPAPDRSQSAPRMDADSQRGRPEAIARLRRIRATLVDALDG
ncbi:MerR family transcriptional regulator [Tsuneonella sp. YG55]|uniref:MerR family transcriptional regulator n=1 Tax=Tsuneonella litorea TaxID=2976475 RepID=A0A9X3A8Y5_9SPHN|nr:MerR family transcriptional regulator [Tsuneonella litorea]MCT2558330.1 MerR family transcriptional regulator [Tsuneonella litorea]